MQKTEVGISDSTDQILEALTAAGLAFSVIEPDGVAHGWMTTERNVNPDGPLGLWNGLRREGDRFRFEASGDQVFDVYGGEHRMLRLQTEQEVKAFLLGSLLSFTGLDVRETQQAVQDLVETDPYRRWAEMHKSSGWCPIWNDRQHYFTERRS